MRIFNKKSKLGCVICFVIALVLLFCTYYVLFELEVQKGDEYVAYLINDNEANANNDTAAFVYDSNEYCFLHPATGYYYRGSKRTEPIGLMKFKGLFYRNRRCELYSFDGDKTSMFLCYDFNDTFFGAKTYYRDDFIIPEVSLKTIEKIELFKGNSNLIVEDTMNNMEADYFVVDKKTVSNILSVFEKERKALLEVVSSDENDYAHLEFSAPTRGLIGYRSAFITNTKGEGVMVRSFEDYKPYVGEISGRKNGVLVTMENGKTLGFSLFNLQERGTLIVGPAEEVYVGMIVGIHNRDNDLNVNPCKNKQLTNTRASGSDEAIALIKPKTFSLEEALEFIQDDELVEVTPSAIRMRKKILDPNERFRENRK